MHLFPARRPSIGLSLSAKALTSVETSPALWPLRHPRTLSIKRQPLGAAALSPSADAQNISDAKALSDGLAQLLGPRRCTPVTVSLPTSSAHIALLDFDTLPAHQNECLALVRWRLEKDFQIPAAACKIAYRTFPCPAHDSPPGRARQRMLVGAIRTDVLAQYEQICEQANLLPMAMGIQGLQLFDLCQKTFQQHDEWFFASFLDEHFFFVAIRRATPFIVRSKPLPKSPAQRQLELLASIQYYDDLCASSGAKPPVSPRTLYFLHDGPGRSAEHTSPPTEPDPVGTLNQTFIDSLRLTICTVEKEDFAVQWPASDTHWTAGLSAWASLKMP